MKNNNGDILNPRFITWMGQFTALYLICDAAMVGIAAAILRITFEKVWIPFVSILISGLILGFLLYGSQQLKSKVNAYCLVFAGSICIYFLLFAFALGFSCIWLGYSSARNVLAWAPYVLIGGIIEFLLLYMLM